MKKLTILLAALCTLGLSSCDMEKYPSDSIQIEDYYRIPDDFASARTGIYSLFTSVTTGTFVLAPEIQADEFNAKLGFSNNYGEIYRWTFGANSQDIEGIWYSYYSVINNCNLYINNANKIIQSADENFSEDDLKLLYAQTGEIYFARAYCFSALASLYCEDYDPETASQKLGIMLQTEYNKTPNDNTTYPGRSTLAETYKQIVVDLDSAEVRLGTAVDGLKIPDDDKNVYSSEGVARSPYITVDAVTALQARVALQMHEYSTAAAKATSLLSGYPLLTTATRLQNMWWEDGDSNGSEIIWLVAMTSKEEAGAQTGLPFLGLQEYDKDFIPSDDLLSLYDVENDKRFSVFFSEGPLKVSSGYKTDVYFFNKYPGNTHYNNLGSTYKCINQSKPLHISEMYLVAAEAYAGLNDLSNASKYLTQLQSKRINGYEAPTFANVNDLMSELRSERARELVGEGFRLMDLKRWKMGVKRVSSQDSRLILFPGDITTDKLDRPATDPRMVWPIPKAEMDANPKMVQNSGY